MNGKTFALIAAASLGLLLSRGSAGEGKSTSSPATTPAGVEVRGAKRIIRLPEIPVTLPDAPGRDVVMVSCGVCHTPAYIILQPPFPRETWVTEVTKMRKTYSAPIPEENVQAIVDYLVAVRGAKTK